MTYVSLSTLIVGPCSSTLRGTSDLLLMLRYDVTKYADRHPGGPRTIYIACGKDCTEVFDHVHSKVKPEIILSKVILVECREQVLSKRLCSGEPSLVDHVWYAQDYIGKISGDAPEEQIAGQRRSHNEERKADCPSSDSTSVPYPTSYQSAEGNRQEIIIKEGEIW